MEKVSASLHREALLLTNKQFDNNKNVLLKKKKPKKIKVKRFKKELMKVNPELKALDLKDSYVYNIARRIILDQLQEEISFLN